MISIKGTPKGQDRGGFSRLECWEGAPCSNSSLTCEITITNNRLDITVYFRWDAS